MTRLLFAAVLCGVLASVATAEDDAKKKIKPKQNPGASQITGTYTIVSGERGGKKLDASELREVKVKIAENAITTYDKDEKQVYVAEYELDTSKKPWRIHLTATLAPVPEGKGAKSEGLVEFEGDSLRLIYALPGGKAPTDFKTNGEQHQLFVLKRTDEKS